MPIPPNRRAAARPSRARSPETEGSRASQRRRLSSPAPQSNHADVAQGRDEASPPQARLEAQQAPATAHALAPPAWHTAPRPGQSPSGQSAEFLFRQVDIDMSPETIALDWADMLGEPWPARTALAETPPTHPQDRAAWPMLQAVAGHGNVNWNRLTDDLGVEEFGVWGAAPAFPDEEEDFATLLDNSMREVARENARRDFPQTIEHFKQVLHAFARNATGSGRPLGREEVQAVDARLIERVPPLALLHVLPALVKSSGTHCPCELFNGCVDFRAPPWQGLYANLRARFADAAPEFYERFAQQVAHTIEDLSVNANTLESAHPDPLVAQTVKQLISARFGPSAPRVLACLTLAWERGQPWDGY